MQINLRYNNHIYNCYRGKQEVEGDPLQGKEGFEAFELRLVSSFNSGECCTVLTMQVKFSSSSITAPVVLHLSVIMRDREAGRREGRRLWAAAQRISQQAAVISPVNSEQLSAVKWTFHS